MKTIKWLLFIMVCCCALPAYPQQPKVKASLQYGFLHGGLMDEKEYPDYTTAFRDEWGWNASADVSFFLTQRVFLTLHVSEGEYWYKSILVNGTPGNSPIDGTPIRMPYTGYMSIGTLGLLVGYNLPLSEWSNVSGQIGFGQFNALDEYDNGRSNYHTVFSASIPVKFSIGFTPFKNKDIGIARNLEFGYTFGMDIEPDFGIFTFIYHGPQVSISF
jgi:hypothetical protein